MKLTARMRDIATAVVLCCFSLLVYARYTRVFGDDLTSSFVACRLLATGQADHLYDRNGDKFDVVTTEAWLRTAEAGGVRRLHDLHPFVQLPLWPWVLEPLCTRLQFPAFYHLFLALSALSASVTIWIAARYWATHLIDPLTIAILCGALLVSEPFKYYFFVGQTHLLFVALSVAAISLDRANNSKAAGVCLGIAAAVKLTPALLLIYWMAARRGRSVLWALACIASIHALAYGIFGRGLMDAYVYDVSALSHALLLAMVNQSVPAWLVGMNRPPSALFDWTIYSLPKALRLGSLAASVLCALVGGAVDYRPERGRPPYGAAFTLVGGMLFAPIAWTHYFIILMIPAMLIIDHYRATRSSPLQLAIPAIVFVLSLYPVSYGSVAALYRRFPLGPSLPLLARGEVFSGLLCMAALLYLGLPSRIRQWKGRARSFDTSTTQASTHVG